MYIRGYRGETAGAVNSGASSCGPSPRIASERPRRGTKEREREERKKEAAVAGGKSRGEYSGSIVASSCVFLRERERVEVRFNNAARKRLSNDLRNATAARPRRKILEVEEFFSRRSHSTTKTLAASQSRGLYAFSETLWK